MVNNSRKLFVDPEFDFGILGDFESTKMAHEGIGISSIKKIE